MPYVVRSRAGTVPVRMLRADTRPMHRLPTLDSMGALPSSGATTSRNSHRVSGVPKIGTECHPTASCLMILGWSVYELARRTGGHWNTIRRWLDGTGTIDPEIAA